MGLCPAVKQVRSVKQLCNPLDADQGAPHSSQEPADWLGADTRDRHVAVLAQPAGVSLETEWRCCQARKWGRCWSCDGPACCRGEGGGGFLMDCLKPVTFPWHRVYCHMPSLGGRGVVPLLSPHPPLQHRRWISCASDPGILTEEEERGRGRSGKGSREKAVLFFIMPVDSGVK